LLLLRLLLATGGRSSGGGSSLLALILATSSGGRGGGGGLLLLCLWLLHRLLSWLLLASGGGDLAGGDGAGLGACLLSCLLLAALLGLGVCNSCGCGSSAISLPLLGCQESLKLESGESGALLPQACPLVNEVLPSETVRGDETLDLGSPLDGLGVILLEQSDLVLDDVFPDVLVLLQVEKLSDFGGPLGSEGSGLDGGGQTLDVLLALLGHDQVQSGNVGADDAATD